MIEFLLLLLPLAAASGWYARHKKDSKADKKKIVDVSRQYIRGLNFLLNDQNDKAIQAFISVLEVDSETVETHLALGNLFRRQGEVERAIRIHQNLIARPNLSTEHKNFALLELGQNYFAAGLFDRAEAIFNQLLKDGYYNKFAIKQLFQIYESTKDWNDAIELIENQKSEVREEYRLNLCHYWCEIADLTLAKEDKKGVKKALNNALKAQPNSARARLIELSFLDKFAKDKQYFDALEDFAKHQTKYLALIADQIEAKYIQTSKFKEYKDFLSRAVNKGAGVSIALKLTSVLQKDNDKEAIVFLSTFLQTHPSLKGLDNLIELHLNVAGDSAQSSLALLKNIVNQLLQTKPLYRCQSCGFSGKQVHWQCPSCKNWDSYQPIEGIEGE